ncbi:unnamed protein product [Rotaria magnacalcarata]|uniref:Uncharacterized protein n=1 Tax=Rotaria magnacalcarata TaxID=392030 RepID=A0A8S2J6G8_9BILA|nr:unnamed protein product [Rotaria magnacalcarata]
MLGFQTLSCLQEIPGKKFFILLRINLYHFIYVVVRSSTTKLQDVYSTAKDTSSFIRLPCSFAETVAYRALKVAVMIANPLVKPLSGPVQRPDTNKIAAATNQILSRIGSLCSSVSESFQPSVVWFRLWIVQVLVKTKETNDILLNKIEQKPFLNNLPQRLLIAADTFLENIIGQIKLNESTSTEWKQPRLNSKPQSANRQYTKPNLFATIRKYVAINEQERNVIRPDEFSHASSMSDTEGLRARSASNDCLKSNDKVEDDEFIMESVDHVLSGDSELYDAQLSADVLPNLDNQETLTDDQQEIYD